MSEAIQKKQESIKALLARDDVRAAIARALPKHLTPEIMIQIAVTTVTRKPELSECTQFSILGAIVEASQLGLSLEPVIGQAYLVPFRNKHTKQREAQLIVGYRGLILLSRNAGDIARISAEIVCEGEKFSVTYGTDRTLVHVPTFDSSRLNRKNWIGAYATVMFTNRFSDFLFLEAAKIEKIKNMSQSKDDGPWVTHEEEMWKKSAIRRLAKLLPQSPTNLNLIRAIEREERRDLGFPVDPVLDIPELREDVIEHEPQTKRLSDTKGESREEFEHDRFGTAGPIKETKKENGATAAERKQFFSDCMMKLGMYQADLKRVLAEKYDIKDFTLNGVSKLTLDTIYGDLKKERGK